MELLRPTSAGETQLRTWHWMPFNFFRSAYIFVIFTFIPSATATIQWDTLISRSRELSMSGVLGLIETSILFAEPGSEQKEFWRIMQALLGIGSLRILSSICKSPSFEFLHQMYGIQPPESVEAREFWLRQPSWTEMSGLGLTQEDTSYHRINQGSGPQAKILWTWDDITAEKSWWQKITQPRKNEEISTNTLGLAHFGSEINRERTNDGITPLAGMPPESHTSGKGITPNIYVSGVGSSVAEGTTDKWWMDRWQCEVLAVASIHNLSIAQASNLLTEAYFGRKARPYLHFFLGLKCCVLTIATFITAAFTDWSWTLQFAALTSLGYFVNRTACLRAWIYQPNPNLRDYHPNLLQDWPNVDREESIVRIAVQSSGFCHLRGLVAFKRSDLELAKQTAQLKKGRYKSVRKLIREYSTPYTRGEDSNKHNTLQWLSYEAQSSFYGLVTSVVPDNVTIRSLSVIVALVNGTILLILGFGGTVADGWSGAVLGIYLVGIILAIFGRAKTAKWTLPEFEVVDLTSMQVPPAVRDRIWTFKGAEKLKGESEQNLIMTKV